MGKAYRIAVGILLLGIVMLGAVWMYQRFQHPPPRPAAWQNLPQGFSVVVYAPSFGRSWKALQSSPLASALVGPLLAQGAAWHDFLERHPTLREQLYGQGTLVALYPEGPLWILEAPFLAGIADWRTAMRDFAQAQGWTVTLEEVEGYTLWKLPNGFLAPAGQLLVYAQQPRLIVRFLRGIEAATPPWPWGEATWAESPPWLAIGWAGPALARRHPALTFLHSIPWAELQLQLTEEGLTATGTWSLPKNLWPHLSPTSFSVAELCPTSTQALLTFRLTDPAAYYYHHLKPRYTPEAQRFAENFFAKIAGEIGLAHAGEPFLLFRLRDTEPLGEKTTTYKGYPLYRIEAGSLLSGLLGEAFAGWERLYGLQLGEWLLLARTLLPLQAAIDAYIQRQTLYERPEFAQKLAPPPKNARILGYFALADPRWLRPWMQPQQYARWQELLRPWQSAYLSLSPRDTASVRCIIQLYWRESTQSPKDTLFHKDTLFAAQPFLPQDSTLEGVQEEYYPNGVLKKRATYIGGILEGEYTEYHPNGALKVQGYYEQGQKVGKWRYFSSKGELIREESWSAEEEPFTSSGAER